MAAPPRPNDLPPDRLAASHDEAEYFTIADDPDEIEIVETDGAFADMPGQRVESEPPDEGFYANLAEVLPDQIKNRITTDLFRLIEVDKEARSKRDQQYEEGIKRTGMGKEAPGGAEFEGASRVVHPMMTEACIDYQSRIMKELMPPSGPVKPGLIGAVTKTKTEKAKRVAEHMNYQITNQIKGARATLEVLFAQVPLGGSQYIRQYWDHKTKRPSWQFASIDKVLVPYAAADFASAKRKTFIDSVDVVEFRDRVSSGMYLDLDLPAPSMPPEPSRAQAASHKVEGVEGPGQNLDNDRELYETMCYLDVSEDMLDAFGRDAPEEAGEMCPYLVTMDFSGRQMLSMYRLWEDGDEAKEPIEHLFEFGFIPWRGAYAIGFPQIIGGLSGAATGALRALLDSAHINNTPAAIALKGSGSSGQTRTPKPGEIVELEGGVETDDIRKRLMTMPFNPPSTVLFQLLGFLVDAAKGVVRTSLDDTPQNSAAPVPVGTQISRVEEGMVVFSAIHGRAHSSMDRLLRGLHRLNRLYLPEEIKVDAAGKEIMVSRADYEGPCDIEPVSDPTIYSDLQRFNQLGYIQQRMMVAPQLWKIREVELAGLKLIKWPDPESLLHVVPEPTEANAVDENLKMVLGQPVVAYPDQDHLAHLQVHLDFMKSPALGANPLLGATFLGPAMKHCVEHIGYYYARHVEQTVGEATGVPQHTLAGDEPQVKVAFDKLLAAASQKVVPQVEEALKLVLPVLMNAAQMLKSLTPPPPIDPSAAALEVAKAETARKTADDQATQQLDTQKLAAETDLDHQRLDIDRQRLEMDRQKAVLDAQREENDNILAMRKMDLDTAFQTGTLTNQEHQTLIDAANVRAKAEGDRIKAAMDLITTKIDADTALQISKHRTSANGSRFKNGSSLTK